MISYKILHPEDKTIACMTYECTYATQEHISQQKNYALLDHYIGFTPHDKIGGRKRVGGIKITKFQHRPALVIFNLFTVDKNILHKPEENPILIN